jgi:alanine dehydrogenase|uniref:Alanine dehydrogenase/pyridine nucleotide transhydrogenase N-terminal domain-containing protein n=1 Tax=viral metagenome TaxID=1070528 RepID=A0A6C0CDI0_9ZZZZ
MYRIGIPNEQHQTERRVSIIPSDVMRLIRDNPNNIAIYIQSNAGKEAGYSDIDYAACGATIVDTIQEVYENADIIVRVKEPHPSEFHYITSRHTVMAFFHFGKNINLHININPL